MLKRAVTAFSFGLGICGTANAVVMPVPKPALVAECPAGLGQSTRLVAVAANGMKTASAQIRFFTRAAPGAGWTETASPTPATLGRNGLGWAWDQKPPGRHGGPVKREGDGKTPAGFFSGGAPFGFEQRNLKNFLVVRPRETVCVDDVRSRFYNRVVANGEREAGMSHEKMWQTRLYRLGLLVGHRTNAGLRGGSCIFLHVWRAPGRPTAGCVALPEKTMRWTQEFLDAETSTIAILPRRAFRAFSHCGLPEGLVAAP